MTNKLITKQYKIFTQLFPFCLAPTAKNSVITSSGIPFVSGTSKNTKNHATAQTTAYMAKTLVSPIELSNSGRVYVTMISPIQNVREHIAMQSPRTRVGKISEQRMFGIGPKPITKQQKYMMTLMVEIMACAMAPKSMTFPRTTKIRDASRTGKVANSSHLHK